jgi:hypothetical protein
MVVWVLEFSNRCFPPGSGSGDGEAEELFCAGGEGGGGDCEGGGGHRRHGEREEKQQKGGRSHGRNGEYRNEDAVIAGAITRFK